MKENDKKTSFFIPQNKELARKNAVLLAHLYYEDLVDFCCNKIRPLSEYMDVVITTSNSKVVELVRENGIKARIELLPEYGRDIASLLDVGPQLAEEYEYICFLHDKKSLQIADHSMGDYYFDLLWRSMVDSTNYVGGIFERFESDDSLGLLVPPIPLEKEYLRVIEDAWDNCYEITSEVAQELELKCDISRNEQPVALGTCFWARTEALKPLFQHEFSCERYYASETTSFSYAIERIFPYVVQSQGFYTAYVSSDCILSNRNMVLQNDLHVSLNLLRFFFDFDSVQDLEEKYAEMKNVLLFAKEHEHLFLYGIGGYAKICLKILEKNNIAISGIILHKEELLPEYLEKYSSFSLDDDIRCEKDKTGIIVLGDRVEDGLSIQKLQDKCAHIYYFAF